jgi:hypothetical protein
VGDNFPKGLSLNKNGNILGMPETTGTYAVTVVATTGTIYNALSWAEVVESKSYPVPFAVKSFQIEVVSEPLIYNNIYARLFLPIDQRLLYRQFIENTKVFEPELIYRSEDPNFGVQSEFKMYVHYGMVNVDNQLYQKNFVERPLLDSEKIFYVNEIGSVTAKDAQGTELYDVVYLNLIDSLQGKSILNKIRLKFLTQVVSQLNLSFFPSWQKDALIDQSNFVYGSVLCYTIPGGGIQILKNLKKYSKSLGYFETTNINLTLDRFVIEGHALSTSSYVMLP